MVKLLAKTILFYLVFISFITLPAVYDIFVLGQVDRKFSHSPWMALEVYALGSTWIWFLLFAVFFILSLLGEKIAKLIVSYPMSIAIGILTAIICFLYTRNEAKSWELDLKPDHFGVIVLGIIFLALFISKKLRKSH